MPKATQAATDTRRVCRKCGTDRPISQFGKNRYGWRARTCRLCFPSVHKWAWHYGGVKFTMERYTAMLNAQGGVCALCRGPQVGRCTKFCVDHDHNTGRVRALLCTTCNRGIGLFGDDPQRLLAAVAYLEKHLAIPQQESGTVDVCEPPRHGKPLGKRNHQLRLLA